MPYSQVDPVGRVRSHLLASGYREDQFRLELASTLVDGFPAVREEQRPGGSTAFVYRGAWGVRPDGLRLLLRH